MARFIGSWPTATAVHRGSDAVTLLRCPLPSACAVREFKTQPMAGPRLHSVHVSVSHPTPAQQLGEAGSWALLGGESKYPCV